MRWQKALWDAVAKNDARLVKKILKMDKVQDFLNPEAEDEDEEQVFYDEEAPLHLAAYCGYNELLSLMLRGGFDVDSYNVFSDDSGYEVTPLHFAVYKNKVGTVRFLLSEGADPDLRGRWGRVEGTAEEFARERGHREALEVIKEFQGGDWEEEGREDAEKRMELRLRLAEAEAARRQKRREVEELDRRILELKSRLGDEEEEEEDEIETEGEGDPSFLLVPSSVLSDASRSLSCSVCLSPPPRRCFSCRECDALVCAGCRSKMADDNRCPCCRREWSGKRGKGGRGGVVGGGARRNRWAERLAEVVRAAREGTVINKNCEEDEEIVGGVGKEESDGKFDDAEE